MLIFISGKSVGIVVFHYTKAGGDRTRRSGPVHRAGVKMGETSRGTCRCVKSGIDMNDKNLSNISHTNWAAVESMDDKGIDYSDIPPLTDAFFEQATLRIPASQAQQLVQIEPDILAWFQAQGGENKALINSILRDYIQDQGEQPAM